MVFKIYKTDNLITIELFKGGRGITQVVLPPSLIRRRVLSKYTKAQRIIIDNLENIAKALNEKEVNLNTINLEYNEFILIKAWQVLNI